MDGNIEENKKLNEIRGKILTIPTIDRTLTKDGACADAKVVGEELARIREQIAALQGGAT